MSEISFNEETLQEVENIKRKYPLVNSAILPVLYIAQREFGYISDDVIAYLSELLDISPTRIKETALFYTMYNKKPVGKYLIQVCHNLTCTMMGAESLIEHIKEKLNISVGDTTKDGLFSLIEVECLGACGTAPVMQVNDDYHESLTAEKVDSILEELKKKSN